MTLKLLREKKLVNTLLLIIFTLIIIQIPSQSNAEDNIELYFGEAFLGGLFGYTGGVTGALVGWHQKGQTEKGYFIGSTIGTAIGVYLPERNERSKSFLGALAGSVIAGGLYYKIWKKQNRSLSKADLMISLPFQVVSSMVFEGLVRKYVFLEKRNRANFKKLKYKGRKFRGRAISPPRLKYS